MKTTNFIEYVGQGYIYLCPECQHGDRSSWNKIPLTKTCRFCQKEFKLNQTYKMDADLYLAIRQINMLETGTVFGLSPEMLENSDLGKSAKFVGLKITPDGDIKNSD